MTPTPHWTAEALAREAPATDYGLGLERAAHECEWMARGYAAYLMQPLLDAAKRIREIPTDAQQDVAQRRDGVKPSSRLTKAALLRERDTLAAELAKVRDVVTAAQALDARWRASGAWPNGLGSEEHSLSWACACLNSALAPPAQTQPVASEPRT